MREILLTVGVWDPHTDCIFFSTTERIKSLIGDNPNPLWGCPHGMGEKHEAWGMAMTMHAETRPRHIRVIYWQ